jgi:hypothetical protein
MMFTPCTNTPPCPHGGMVHDIEDLEDQVPLCCIEGCYCGHAADCQMRIPPPVGFPFSCFSCNCRTVVDALRGKRMTS